MGINEYRYDGEIPRDTPDAPVRPAGQPAPTRAEIGQAMLLIIQRKINEARTETWRRQMQNWYERTKMEYGL